MERSRPAAGAPVTVSREAPPHTHREAREAPPDKTRSDETRSDEPADGFRLPDAERPHLRALDASLRSQLEVWFDAGLLQLLRVRWERSPVLLLERLISYERVHPMAGWWDLRRRLCPHRRVFAFVHPRMGAEPLVFVQAALLPRVATHLYQVLPKLTEAPPLGGSGGSSGSDHGSLANAGDSSPTVSMDSVAPNTLAAECGVAVLYSISSPFEGLRGVPLGGLLIKQVVASLRRELSQVPISPICRTPIFPISQNAIPCFVQLHTFVTLSPVPGFSRWLRSRVAICSADGRGFVEAAERRQLEALGSALRGAGGSLEDLFDGVPCAAQHDLTVRETMLRLCARYLCLGKRRRRALDPVAAFHLRNGARLHALHWAADPTLQGRQQSAGVMVNYVYVEEEIARNHSTYISTGDVAASVAVRQLVER